MKKRWGDFFLWIIIELFLQKLLILKLFFSTAKIYQCFVKHVICCHVTNWLNLALVYKVVTTLEKKMNRIRHFRFLATSATIGVTLLGTSRISRVYAEEVKKYEKVNNYRTWAMPELCDLFPPR